MERESRTLEYKREISDLKKIARTVVAFANGGGGEILIGIDDKTRKVTGLKAIEIDSLLEKLPVSLADQIRPSLVPVVFSKSMEDREVLIVKVFPGSQKPYYLAQDGVEKGVYVRVGAHTRRAEGEILQELKLFAVNLSYDESPIPACPRADLDLSLLPPSLRNEKAMFSLDLLRRDEYSGATHPTRGAVLMLCQHPEKYVAEAEVIVSRMRGNEGRNTLESHVINGSLPAQAEHVLDLLGQWTGKSPALKKGRFAATEYKLPPVAIRESLHNALFHRQYSISGAVKVALYADRLEIFSPGHFAGPFIPSDLGDGTSYIRNRVLCLVARRMGLMEKRGTGIRAIQDSMKQAGLKAPDFKEGANWFKVTLPMQVIGDAVSVGNPENVIINLFNEQTVISSADVCKALRVSKATAVSYIERLISQRRLRQVGAGPKTRYVLTEI